MADKINYFPHSNVINVKSISLHVRIYCRGGQRGGPPNNIGVPRGAWGPLRKKKEIKGKKIEKEKEKKKRKK